MGHGGKREGAGRRNILNEDQRFRVGITYVNRVNALSHEEGKRRARALNNNIEDIEANHKHLQAVTLDERHKWFKIYDPLEEGDHVIDGIVGDIAAFFPEGSSNSRVMRSFPVRPYGKRKQILEEIAREASEYYGVMVSPRLVEHCVEEFNAWMAADRQSET